MDIAQFWNVSVFLGAGNAQEPGDGMWVLRVSGCSVSPARGGGLVAAAGKLSPPAYCFKLALM